MSLIFKRSSYVIGLGLEKGTAANLQSILKLKDIRLLNCLDLSELEASLSQISFTVGLIVQNPEGFDLEKIFTLANQKSLNTYLYDYKGELPKSPSNLFVTMATLELNTDTFVHQLLQNLVPLRLKDLATYSAQKTLCAFINNIDLNSNELTFSKTEHHIHDFDKVVICDTHLPPYVGRVWVKMNMDKLMAHLQQNINSHFDDYFMEFTNQYLGTFNYNLQLIGYIPSVGLPKIMTAAEFKSYLHSGPYLPTVIITSEHEFMSIEIGIIHQEGIDSIDLSQVPLSSPEEEEFELF